MNILRSDEDKNVVRGWWWRLQEEDDAGSYWWCHLGIVVVVMDFVFDIVRYVGVIMTTTIVGR